MSNTAEANSDTAQAPAQKRGNELGISRVIYGAGTSMRDGLIGFIAISSVLFATFTFGKNFTFVKGLMNFLAESKHFFKNLLVNTVKTVFGEAGEKMLSKIQGWFSGEILVRSAAAGWFLSHFVMVPGGHVGFRKAQGFIDKHNALLDEKDQLVETNKILMVENSQLKSKLSGDEVSQPAMPEPAPQTPAPEQKPAASFASRVSAQPEPAGGLGVFL